MNEDYVNAYIDVLNKKIDELVKNELLNLTRLSISEKLNRVFSEENQALKTEIETLQASLNKKSAKSKENLDNF
jgi:uncharacterized small protein (DUF1192 family)